MAAPISPPDHDLKPGTPEVSAQGETHVMGFFEHLEELRMRLTRAGAAVLIGMLISLLFTNEVISYLSRSYGDKLALLEPTDSVVTFFRVALMLGAILAMPMITYQVFMFVIPALTKNERRWVFLALPGTTALFLGGVLFTWFFLIPLYINFLKTFQGDIFETVWTADAYITFVTAVLFWHGAAFETPLIFYVLGRMGLVTAQGMIRWWRQAIVGAAVLSALITPTVDPVTMSVIMVILIGLYVASIGLVFTATRMNRKRLETSAP